VVFNSWLERRGGLLSLNKRLARCVAAANKNQQRDSSKNPGNFIRLAPNVRVAEFRTGL